jgi:hypothetical protein
VADDVDFPTPGSTDRCVLHGGLPFSISSNESCDAENSLIARGYTRANVPQSNAFSLGLTNKVTAQFDLKSKAIELTREEPDLPWMHIDRPCAFFVRPAPEMLDAGFTNRYPGAGS